MKIKYYNIYKKTIYEIGKFAILWNDLEYSFLSYGKYRLLEQLYDRIVFDELSYETLRQFFADKKIRYGNTDTFIKCFFPEEADRRPNDNEMKKIIAFVNNDCSFSRSDHFYGCIAIIKRYRDNLMHGIKDAYSLNSQFDIFHMINNFLESIHDK